MIQSIDF